MRVASIVCPEESPQCARRRKPLPRGYADSPKGVQGGERKAPLLATIGDNFAVSKSPWWGLTRRLRCEGRAYNLHGVLIYFGGDPKGVQGGERKATLHCSKVDNLVVRKSPLRGPDAPTPAREKGLQPYGALTLFFRWRKKSVQKKASGTATPGKSPLLSIFERGSSQCRAQHG